MQITFGKFHVYIYAFNSLLSISAKDLSPLQFLIEQGEGNGMTTLRTMKTHNRNFTVEIFPCIFLSEFVLTLR